jgi:hypothetical protein
LRRFGTLKLNKMKAANVTKTKSKKLKGADKTPGGKTGGTNPALKKQTTPKGRTGGTTTAPSGAVPKAKMGGSKKSC